MEDVGRDDHPDPERVLAFYDRLRARVSTALSRRGGRWGERLSNVLLLAPDVFMLLARLALDPEAPRETRRLVGGALLYFLMPVDLLPEALTGVVGFTDDVVLASIVLTEALRADLQPLVERHWSGSGRARLVLTDVARSASTLLGEDLFARLRSLLARRGVPVES
ncbi:MAG: YkvA family protein [Thermoanaerobaculia bacterium]